MTQDILLALTLFCYFISTLKYFIYLSVRKKMFFVFATVGVILGFILQTATLISISMKTGHGPYTNLFEYTLFFTWLIVFFFLVTEYFKSKLEDLGTFIIPVVLLFLVYAVAQSSDAHNSLFMSKDFLLTIHITFSFVGNAALAVTFGIAMMYMLQERELKSRKPGGFFHRLPALEILDVLNYKGLYIGFSLLTLGILTGGIRSSFLKGSFFSWDMKKTLPLLITWFIYAVLFVGRILAGWRGKRAAIFAIFGFFAMIISYFIHAY